MKGQSWFRFYSNVISDPKVWSLSAERYRFWTGTLCLAALYGGTLPCLSEIAYALRVNEKQARAMLDFLIERKLLDVNDKGEISPHNWNGRQYKSDVSTDRTRRFKERSRAAPGNVPGTPRARDRDRTDTETEQIQSGNVPHHADETFETLWQVYPAKGRIRRILAEQLWADLMMGANGNAAELAQRIIEPIMPGGKWAASKQWAKGFVMGLPDYLTQRRWSEEPEPAEADFNAD